MLKTGEFAPGFELPDLGDERHSLSSLLEQGRIILAFFKVSCPTCQMTLPFLERLAQQSTARVFGVSQDNAGLSGEFRKEFELTFPVLVDGVERGYPVSNAFGLTHVPSLFLVERDGLISWSSNGFHRGDLQELASQFNIGLFHAEDRVPEWKPG